MSETYRSVILAVPCPSCGAVVGEDCVSRNGKSTHQSHAARLDLCGPERRRVGARYAEADRREQQHWLRLDVWLDPEQDVEVAANIIKEAEARLRKVFLNHARIEVIR